MPVKVASIETGSIAEQRTFNGTLEPDAEFFAAPRVDGIVERVLFDIGDAVSRGQVVARLDSQEYDQAVRQADAEVAVANARLQEARSQLQIAQRELERIDRLSEKGVTSASQRDLAKADQLARQAQVQVARAELEQAKAELETANIQRSYTEVVAEWHGDDAQRVVAERLIDEGQTVSANQSLLKVVRLDPLAAVIFVTEKDYAGLQVGMAAELVTDAYPGQVFKGQVERVAPVFRNETRQARIEVSIANPDQLLKPGMFARVSLILREETNATLVPFQALVRRDEQQGIFHVSADRQQVSWLPVKVGIQQGEKLQLQDVELQGEVVILGQQLLKDGSSILLPDEMTETGEADKP